MNIGDASKLIKKDFPSISISRIRFLEKEGFIFTGLKYWWLILPAGLSVTLLAGGFYLVGRGLDDVFNPRLRRR